VWSLAQPQYTSTGGLSGDNGYNSFALSSPQNNEDGTTSQNEKAAQAALVREV